MNSVLKRSFFRLPRAGVPVRFFTQDSSPKRLPKLPKKDTSTWTEKDLKLVGLPTIITPSPPQVIAPWITPEGELPDAIQNQIGEFSLSNQSLTSVHDEIQAVSDPGQVLSFIADILHPIETLESVTPLANLAHYLINLGGMNRLNNFYVTPGSVPRNKLALRMNDKKLTGVLDIGAWHNPSSSNELALGMKIELKMAPDLKLPQFLGQLLLQASHQIAGSDTDQKHENESITVFGLVLCGYLWRFGSLTTTPHYLRSLSNGIIDSNNLPIIKISDSFSLLESTQVKLFLGLIHGRLKMFESRPIERIFK